MEEEKCDLPATIQYNAVPITIKHKPLHKNYGYWRRKHRKLAIDSHAPLQARAEVLLHELMHAIIDEHVGLEERFHGKTIQKRERSEEVIVDTVARDLVQIFKNNKQLLKWFAGAI